MIFFAKYCKFFIIYCWNRWNNLLFKASQISTSQPSWFRISFVKFNFFCWFFAEVYKRLSIPTLSEYTKNQKCEEIQLNNNKGKPFCDSIRVAAGSCSSTFSPFADTYRVNNSVSTLVTNNNVLPSLLSSPAINGDDSYTNESSQAVNSAWLLSFV